MRNLSHLDWSRNKELGLNKSGRFLDRKKKKKKNIALHQQGGHFSAIYDQGGPGLSGGRRQVYGFSGIQDIRKTALY
eukprot:577300-Ditylum_brightwellii.AAC.1